MKVTVQWRLLVWLISSLVFVNADFDCICNYAVENNVYAAPDASSKILGYLYEFDCKALANGQGNGGDFNVIQYMHTIGYVPKSNDVTSEVCSGEISTEDKLTTAPTTSTTILSTPASPTSSPSTPSPSPTLSLSSASPAVLSTLTTTKATPSSTAATTTTAATTESQTTSTSTEPSTTSTLPSTSVATTTISPYWQNAVNVTGTRYEHIGTGYNLLNGNPFVNPDPGFNTTGRVFLLTGNGSTINEVIHNQQNGCSKSTITNLILGSKSYQQELKEFVIPSATHNANIQTEAFTFSTDFESLRPAFEDVHRVYIDKISKCEMETVHYQTEKSSQGNFTVSPEFAKAVCSLPVGSSADDISKYLQFLDNWGTSIVTSVDYGTLSVQRSQSTPQELFVNIQHTDPSRIQHSGDFQNYKSSVIINTTNIQNSPALRSSSAVPQTFTLGTLQEPEVIGLKLAPISDALNWTYWRAIAPELVVDGICPEIIAENQLSTYLNNMKNALRQYPDYRRSTTGHNPVKDHAIQVAITWPNGTYGFMESTYGCPDDGQITWLKGSRHQDTEDFRSHNTFSYNIQHYMKGNFGSNNIDSYFCIKTRHNISPYDQNWPRGAYCLLKKGTCPSGFGSGYIYWDDDDFPNHNDKHGTLPDGTFDKNTKIYYCCRSDGSTRNAIYLPTERPFILVRYGNTCQTVHGMTVRDLYIGWDDEDVNNKNSAGGMHPKDFGDSHNHKLYFCYYQSAAHGPNLIG
ncbi:hypothetical protein ACF0H5_016514 [Mactra antiquata]